MIYDQESVQGVLFCGFNVVPVSDFLSCTCTASRRAMDEWMNPFLALRVLNKIDFIYLCVFFLHGICIRCSVFNALT